MSLSLEDAVARVPQWRGAADLAVSDLPGGLTNKNYRVRANGQDYVLRLTDPDSHLLGINRNHEHVAQRTAAALGLAPAVAHFIEPEGCLVSAFVGGRLVPREEMLAPQNLGRAADIIRRMHAMPPIPGAFSPFQRVDDYLALSRARGVAGFPDDFDHMLASKRAIQAALAHQPASPCPCHNDLINANFLLVESSGQLVILDWEYAAMGDPFFDLGNFAGMHDTTHAQDLILLERYAGQQPPAPAHLARLKVMKIMSHFREAMWGMAQVGLSTLEFDYRGYAFSYFERLTAALAEPDLPAWLEELARYG